MPVKSSPAVVPVDGVDEHSVTTVTNDLPEMLRRGPSARTMARHEGSPIRDTEHAAEPKAQMKKAEILRGYRQLLERKRPTGLLECILFIVALGCVLWTLWLILLTVHPNDTVNEIMKTEKYDSGSFWLLIEPPSTIKHAGVFGFAIVLSGYVFILLKLTLWRKQRASRQSATSSGRVESVQRNFDSIKLSLHQTITSMASESRAKSMTKSAAALALELVSESTATRKFLKVILKIVDFGLYFAMLVQSLENGYPLVLIYVLAAIIVFNSIVLAMTMCLKRFQSGFLQVVVNCLFDFLIAIGFPMIVVMYCLSTFEFDRKKLAINEAVFPPGRYERQARVIANPVAMANVLNSLDSLRIESATTFFTRVGTNLSLCVELAALATRRHQLKQKKSSLYPYRHPIALLFILLPLVIVVYVLQSVASSHIACAPHPECAVYAFRWNSIRNGDLTKCPCLALIAGDASPKTYTEWQYPKNVTEKVAQLASSGDLRAVQLTNKLLPALPDEMRRCTNLKHLTLFYTRTETLPPWAKEFTQLEFLHIEGSLDITTLASLPDDLFDNMGSLTYIQLGAHSNLRRLPNFKGLVNLKSLTLALLVKLEELPNFSSLAKLEWIAMPLLSSIDYFPDMSSIRKLLGFVLSYRGRPCCNGYLDNKCNLTKHACYLDPSWKDSTPLTCLPVNRTDKIATEATRQFFAQFPRSVCSESTPPTIKENQYPLEADVNACNGTLYRKCIKAGNRTGMCYSLRMMAIACAGDPFPMAMRKRQILENVGDPCSPVEEA